MNSFLKSAALLIVISTSILIYTQPVNALTCPQRTFSQKVQASQNILVGEITKTQGKRYQIKILKILKTNGLLPPKNNKIWIHISRYSGFGFPVKKGNLLFFFFQKNSLKWLCNGPILLN